ncbi:3-phosphoshikimate 1-carboxyvinyltransferase [Cutibacterium sp. WCA-380-WT-3A]|uniref:3-phosphoshikimate 1-carboxyvinyltransferase n=1 Tax=Cutibacterium porci TaxID=2605781 RepID=A0A7K0J628_9ACTN|nr:3-phosphoshikimate 1-carboxyvinyltransferase [Cutibacterium porci]MSS45395.1 3-phosphoshikimate 1-carboxyvinyltransferase [Cutibacterium porci]
MLTDLWTAPRANHRLAGRVVIPGSKSQTNRALVLAALSDGPSVLDGVLSSRDSDLMSAGLRRLGVNIRVIGPSSVQVVPHLAHPTDPIDCGLAGTVMRFLPAVAALVPGTTRFVGDEQASRRPIKPVLDGLRQLGVDVDSDQLPFSLNSPACLGGPEVTIDSAASSQFISALLLVAARFPQGIDLRHDGTSVPSAPHIAMTCAMLADRGVTVMSDEPCHWVVHPGPIHALDDVIEPDLTNAAVFLAAALVVGGTVTVPGWPVNNTQPGAQFIEIATAMGATASHTDGDMTLTAPGWQGLQPIDVDLHEASELTPVVAAVASVAHGRSRIRGVAHIRGHETDRLAALEQELTNRGVEIHQTDDGLDIAGRGAAILHGGTFRCYADHRMAHAGAILGLVIDGIDLDDIGCTSKTMPTFPQMWADLIQER